METEKLIYLADEADKSLLVHAQNVIEFNRKIREKEFEILFKLLQSVSKNKYKIN